MTLEGGRHADSSAFIEGLALSSQITTVSQPVDHLCFANYWPP